MKLEGEYALIGATLIDGNGGTPVKDTTIVVRNGVMRRWGISNQWHWRVMFRRLTCLEIT